MSKEGGKEPRVIDVVSQDKDWRSRVEGELRFQDNWQGEWGFLAVEYSKKFE